MLKYEEKMAELRNDRSFNSTWIFHSEYYNYKNLNETQ